MSLLTEFILVFTIGVLVGCLISRKVYKAYMRWPGDHS